jgi:hypothetical protein
MAFSASHRQIALFKATAKAKERSDQVSILRIRRQFCEMFGAQLCDRIFGVAAISGHFRSGATQTEYGSADDRRTDGTNGLNVKNRDALFAAALEALPSKSPSYYRELQLFHIPL